MARSYWCCYYSYLDYMQRLNDEERGQLFTALIIYARDGEVPLMNDKVGLVFDCIRSQVDRDTEEYEAKCIKSRQSAAARWNANGCERMRTDANACKEKEKEKEKETYTRARKPRPYTGFQQRPAEGVNYDDIDLKID